MVENKVHVLNASKQAPVAEASTMDAGKPDVTVELMRIASEEKPAAKKRGKSFLLGATALAVIAAAAYYGHNYWTVGRFQVSTDDAYVQADNSAIAPKISGYITGVVVNDNQTVKAGQVLARIDDRDFKTALDQAKADVAAAQADVEAKQASLDMQQSLIAAAQATVDVDKANETFAEQNDKRYASLSVNGYAPVQTAQQAASQIAAARAAIDRDTASLAGTIKQVDLLKAQLAQARATLAHDQAVQSQAELNLSYTTIVAPLDGVIGNRTLRVGQYVQAGTQLMSVVPTSAAYIVANYKETQLTDVHAGQPVDIEVDMFPGRVYHGHVDSLAPASGQEFALLPPDNATGNFTKVVQRIPVKIVLDGDSAASGDLRPGMSVQPSIDIKTADQSHGA
ncbi:HlyD family secretion protein [Rhizobium sp. CB3060]|uniref:HlyD family secretion protein n=1 Tax=Rhizobium sp. CB3060 TaxID=3138255 RepID=UPI0040549335